MSRAVAPTHRRDRAATAIVLGLLALTLGVAPAALSAGSLEVTAEPLELTVGDRVVVTLTFVPPVGDGGPPSLPAWGTGRWGEAEVLEVGDVRQVPGAPGERRYVQEIVVTLFDTGVFELPPIAVESASGEPIRSQPLELSVRSILPAAQDGAADLEARPPAALRELPRGRAFWWTVLLLSAGGVVACAALVGRRQLVQAIAPKVDPLDQFERFARSLEAEDDPISFHTQLSFALRRFLGTALGFPAVESTTTEIRHRLRQRSLPPETVRHATQLLRDCDQVKFAHLLAGRRGPTETLAEANRLARDVYRDVRPATDSTDGAEESAA